MARPFIAAAAALAAFALAGASAQAGEATGVWLRTDTGASKVKIAPCGGALCGNIVWLKDPENSPAKMGQRIFFDMKPSGDNAWEGNAFNPENGKTYSGTMKLSGNTLTTAGCVLGGLVCKSVVWSRAN